MPDQPCVAAAANAAVDPNVQSGVTGGPGTCWKLRDGTSSTTIAIRPDGRSACLIGYESSPAPPVLSAFHRDPKAGVLRQFAGKAEGSSSAGHGTHTKARDLDTGDATALVIPADGRFVSVASQHHPYNTPVGGTGIFSRNTVTGAPHQ